jgi:hypothetical protein
VSNIEYAIFISKWLVGYHIEHNEIFLYKIDQDRLVWVFRMGGLDAIGFYEFVDFSEALELGEL